MTMRGRFVVHEHHGRQRHFDLRLEIDGVLKSWAVPKGPSMNPAERRLAVAVPDHPVEYLGFEGVIPPGQYGAGPVVIWDSGVFSAEGNLRHGELLLVLCGQKLHGGFALIRLARGDGTDWLLIKRRDEYAEPRFRLQSALTPLRRRALVERTPVCGIE